MKSLKFAAIALSAIGLSVFAPVGTKADLVTNGSFESYTGGDGSGNPSQLAGPSLNGTGYTTLTGWTSGNVGGNGYNFLMAPGSADTVGSYAPEYSANITFWGTNNGGNDVIPATSPDGGNFVAMDPSFMTGPLSQSVSVTNGGVYQLSFYWAAAQQHGFDGPTTEGLNVSLGSQTQSTTTYNNPSHDFSGWMAQTFTFSATSTGSETLSFYPTGGPDSTVPPFVFLDGVSLTPVPEPSTMIGSLVMFGLFGAVWARKRLTA